MTTDDLDCGQRVIWRRTQRGGYGFVQRICATVVRFTAKRVVIVPDCQAGTVTVPASCLEPFKETVR